MLRYVRSTPLLLLICLPLLFVFFLFSENIMISLVFFPIHQSASLPRPLLLLITLRSSINSRTFNLVLEKSKRGHYSMQNIKKKIKIVRANNLLINSTMRKTSYEHYEHEDFIPKQQLACTFTLVFVIFQRFSFSFRCWTIP